MDQIECKTEAFYVQSNITFVLSTEMCHSQNILDSYVNTILKTDYILALLQVIFQVTFVRWLASVTATGTPATEWIILGISFLASTSRTEARSYPIPIPGIFLLNTQYLRKRGCERRAERRIMAVLLSVVWARPFPYVLGHSGLMLWQELHLNSLHAHPQLVLVVSLIRLSCCFTGHSVGL